MKFYTYDSWVNEFQPIINPLRNPDGNGDFLEIAFETYGDEQDYVEQQDNHNVWTEVDGEYGTCILSGWHYVNRIQYYITTKPWNDGEDFEVLTWAYRECDNAEEGECDRTCELCNGDSVIDVPCETVEDLKVIYGEDVEIV